MPHVRLVHSPRVGCVLVNRGGEEFAFHVFLSVDLITVYKSRFRVYSYVFLAVVENYVLGDFREFRSRHDLGFRGVSRYSHTVRLRFENNALTPVYGNVARFLYRLRSEFFAVFVVNFYYRIIVDIMLGGDNGKFALDERFSPVRLRRENHERISSLFRHRLTFAQREKRVRPYIVEYVQSVVDIGEAVFLARLYHIAGENVVELNVQHIFRNVFQKPRGIIVSPFKRRRARDFFRKHKLTFEVSVLLFEFRHGGVAADHAGYERLIENFRGIHVREIFFRRGIFYLDIARFHHFFHGF